MSKTSRFFTTFITVIALIFHLYGPWAVIATEATHTGLPWPSSWTTPSECFSDPAGEAGIGDSRIDLVGSPAVGYASDSNYRYFRERVDTDPYGPGMFTQKAWVVLFQTTPPGYQYLLSINGLTEQVEFYRNTSEAGAVDFNPLLNDPAEQLLWWGSTGTYARITAVGDGSGDHYVDWAVPKSVLSSHNTGITSSTTKFFATSATLF